MPVSVTRAFRDKTGLPGGGAARVTRAATWALALGLAACANQKRADSVIGVSSELELTEGAAPPPPRAPPTDPGVVHEAARPFTGYRSADDRSFSRESFLTHLAAADAICIGERHDQPLDHYAELAIIEGLLERRAMRGFELSLGLEMVRKKYQAALTSYGQGLLSVPQLSAATAWEKEWGFPIEYYVPALDAVRSAGASSLAFGVERELTAAIAQAGIDGLPPQQSRDLPEIDFESKEHHELFQSMMAGHPPGNLNFLYEAQLVWDESMADQSSSFLRAHAPSRKLVVLAGAAHCHRRAIPDRIERRGKFTVVSVLPVEVQPVRLEKTDNPSAEERLSAGYDYQLVFDRH